MLNQSEETFLLKLRMTLLERGKDENVVEAIEEELRDHFHEAHAHGHSTKSITDHSVESYINHISQEVPHDRKWVRFLTKTITIVLLLTILPSFFYGQFNLTLGLIIHLAIVLLVGFLIWKVIKTIVIKWGYEILSRDKTPIKLYVACFFLGIIVMGLFVASIYFTSHYPIYTFITLSSRTSLIVGCVLIGIILCITALKKEWMLMMVTLVITLPNLITFMIFGNNESQQAVTTEVVILLILLIVFNVVNFMMFRKTDKEADER
ncbi:hypothetical protein MUA73_02310 [Staphylococcus simulans]|uniref:hypothetical protein n=1 Tax=Staphylococcus simulans TaxID=1286 RepID=UPI0021D32259|nr:hypothetical protein [Staphylococcus simulans]UXR30732.1 hypothetical protein MUA73_02310 [Staphylococcus simulans]